MSCQGFCRGPATADLEDLNGLCEVGVDRVLAERELTGDLLQAIPLSVQPQYAAMALG